MATILIVDDEATNRALLASYLADSGHVLLEADSGATAITLAESSHPDLVLLDVIMPGLDGFETARRLKESAGEDFLPIILITALSDRASRTKGLRAGVDELLSKPVDRVELELRMSNLLSLRAHLAERRKNELALEQKAVELAELYRFKEEMVELLVHDLKNPLSAIIMNLDYLKEGFRDLPPTTAEALTDVQTASKRLSRLVANLLDVSRLEANRLELHRSITTVRRLLEPIVHQRSIMARSRQIALELSVDGRTRVNADTDLVSRVVENLLDNAFRYAPRGGCIRVSAMPLRGRVQIEVGNSGPPIPASARELIFEKFGQTKNGHGRMNLGLGLYFCRLAVETHGGQLCVEERTDLPTVFKMDLPGNDSQVFAVGGGGGAQ